MAVSNRSAEGAGLPLTLDQRRAADAWRCVQDKQRDYVNLAKGLPALIMNSGLLQVMAFLEEKDSKPSQRLACQMRAWLHQRFPNLPEDFKGFMQAVMATDPRPFQEITAESLAWLRWLRQLAAAVNR